MCRRSDSLNCISRLSQGVVDGEENPVATIWSAKFYEVQKYLSLTQHTYQAIYQVVNLGTWKKLTPEQQKIMREEGAAAGKLNANSTAGRGEEPH